MPCYDPRSHGGANTIIKYESGISPQHLAQVEDQLAKAEAINCALLNELERRNIVESVIAEASRHGLIDIMSFWVQHKKEDKARLIAGFHKHFSKDEQQIIKAFLEQES